MGKKLKDGRKKRFTAHWARFKEKIEEHTALTGRAPTHAQISLLRAENLVKYSKGAFASVDDLEERGCLGIDIEVMRWSGAHTKLWTDASMPKQRASVKKDRSKPVEQHIEIMLRGLPRPVLKPKLAETVSEPAHVSNGGIDMTPLTNGERSRTYMFPNEKGEMIPVKVNNVTHLCVRPSGYHRLLTATGSRYIVRPDWLVMEIDADDWSV